MMHTFYLPIHPDTSKPIGGVKQVHRLAETLLDLGYDSYIVQDSADFHPGWFSSEVKAVSLNKGKIYKNLDPSCNTIILPETFLPHIPYYYPTIPKIIFNQNFSYTFGPPSMKGGFDLLTPSDVISLYRHPSIFSVWTVSSHDARAVSDSLPLRPHVSVSRIFNHIDTNIFNFGHSKKRQFAYMPRKNKRDSEIICSLLNSQDWFKGWKLLPISDLSQSEVSSVFKDSVGFISTGHPEGFGLPLAEAAACGCNLFGYDGIAGSEIFDVCRAHGFDNRIGFGDWASILPKISNFISCLKSSNDIILGDLYKISCDISELYSLDSMKDSVVASLDSYFRAKKSLV